MSGELTRREFLKIGVAGIEALMVSNLRVIEMFKWAEFPLTDTERAIFIHLNLTPEQVRISENDWIFAGHTMSHWTLGRISGDGSRKPIVVGELAAWMTERVLTQKGNFPNIGMRERILNPGIGASAEKLKDHARSLAALIVGGSTVVNTDGDNSYLYVDGSYHADYTMKLLLAGIVMATSLNLALGRKSVAAKGKDLALTVAGLAAAFGFGEFIKENFDAVMEMIGRTPFIDIKNEVDLWLEKVINRNPAFINFLEGTLKWRNSIMAQNIWHTIAHSVGPETCGQEVVVVAANGHNDVQEIFLNGPDKLKTEIIDYAQRLVQYGIELSDLVTFSSEKGSGKFTSEVAAQILAGYGWLFSEPTSVGGQDLFLPKKLIAMKIPPSARAILIEVVNRRQQELSQKPELTANERNELQMWGYMEAFLSVDLAGQMISLSAAEQTIDPSKIGGDFILDLTDSILYFSADKVPTENLLSQLLEGTNSDFKPGIVVGKIIHHGTVYPVIRLAEIKDGKIRLTDNVLLPRQGRIMGKTWEYRPQDDNSTSLTQGDKVLVLKVSGQKLISSQVRDFDPHSDNSVYVCGEADKFGIGAVIVEYC